MHPQLYQSKCACGNCPAVVLCPAEGSGAKSSKRSIALAIVRASARPSATRGTLFGTSSYGGHLCLKPPTVPGVDGCGWFSGEPAPGNAWKRKHQIQQHDRNDTEMPSPCSQIESCSVPSCFWVGSVQTLSLVSWDTVQMQKETIDEGQRKHKGGPQPNPTAVESQGSLFQ